MSGITITKIDNLIHVLRQDPQLQHYEYGWDEWHTILSKITIKQYKYIYAMLFNHKYDKLKDVINTLSFQSINK
jgi:hypothetical protein